MVLTQVIHTVLFTLVRYTTNPILSITLRSFPYREAPIFCGRGVWGGQRCSGENAESRFALGTAVHRAHSGEDRFALCNAASLWGFTQSTQSLRSKRLYPEQRFACGVTQFPQSTPCARFYPEQRGIPHPYYLISKKITIFASKDYNLINCKYENL